MAARSAVRTLVAWCPDWPVTAAAQAAGCPPDTPVAVLDRGLVLACSAVARASGVRRGIRTRDAQSRCPDLAALAYDPALDARAFEPVVGALEVLVPGVEVIRPGTCAVRARGPSRFYGGDAAAGESVVDRLAGFGVADCRVGVADGPFAAQQAARATEPGHRVHVVPPGQTPRFLAPLPVGALERPDLADLLRRLGLRTLGAFAELPTADVLARFGIDGALAHRLARGTDDRTVAARRPPPELTRVVDFEPSVDRADQVAFSVRAAADALVAGLADHGLVCTTLRVEVGTDSTESTAGTENTAAGRLMSRRWLHPRWFDAADVVDRVRWQLEGSAGGAKGSGDTLTAPVVRVRLVPDEVDPHGAHVDGLWGGGPEEHLHRALSRVQSMLGHEAVGTPVVGGGRGPANRQTLVPWGDRARSRWPVTAPWPGSLPAPLPATVFAEPVPATVASADDRTVMVDGRGVLSAEPARFVVDGEQRPVATWAGPWPVEERWWDETAARRLARFQVVGVDGSAWLLVVEGGRWWVEARYD